MKLQTKREADNFFKRLADQYTEPVGRAIKEMGHRNAPVTPKVIFCCQVAHGPRFADALYDHLSEYSGYDGEQNKEEFRTLADAAAQLVAGLDPNKGSTVNNTGTTSTGNNTGTTGANYQRQTEKSAFGKFLENTTLGIKNGIFYGIVLALIIIFIVVLLIRRRG